MEKEQQDKSVNRDGLPFEFYEELNQLFDKYIRPKNEHICDSLTRICSEYLVSHNLYMIV